MKHVWRFLFAICFCYFFAFAGLMSDGYLSLFLGAVATFILWIYVRSLGAKRRRKQRKFNEAMMWKRRMRDEM